MGQSRFPPKKFYNIDHSSLTLSHLPELDRRRRRHRNCDREVEIRRRASRRLQVRGHARPPSHAQAGRHRRQQGNEPEPLPKEEGAGEAGEQKQDVEI